MNSSDPKFQEVRRKAQTDLYYLGKSVLKKDFVEGTHRQMTEFYVVKNPDVRFREFGMSYPGSHDRMQLIPRKTYKSSIKVIDAAQWVINYPEIRIMTVTATADLAEAFIDELIAYFTVRGKAQRNPETNRVEGGRPTAFQELFPEHAITENEATTGEFWTPARANIPPQLLFKDPTAGTLSMAGTTSGWHCDILDYDDPVSDKNAETGLQLEKLHDRMAMIYELVESHGFRHSVATRYHPEDPYGRLAQSHGIVELYGDFDRNGLKYMCRPCWWLKGKPFDQPNYAVTGCPKEDDVDLFFPEGAPYRVLKKKFLNPKTFFSQQLNDPQNAAGVEFTDELLRSVLIDHTALPKTGSTFVSWDLANTATKVSDYSCGIVGLIDDQRRWWIIDIISGRWNFSERCLQVVKAIQTHHPRRTCIEDVHGIQDSMREPLDRQAKLLKVPLDIDWPSGHAGGKDSKYIRMCSLHPWMTDRRLFILNSCNYIDDYIQQFKRLRAVAALNDIPDAMSQLVEQYTRYAAEVKAPTSSEDQIRWREMEDREFQNMMFQRGKFQPVEPVPVFKEDPRESPSYAIDELFQ